MCTFLHMCVSLQIDDKKIAVKDHNLLERSLVGENRHSFSEHQF